jgi:hypothetical protein
LRRRGDRSGQLLIRHLAGRGGADGHYRLTGLEQRQQTGRGEEEILRHYRLTGLEELPALTANRILERLIRLDHDARQVRRRDGGEAGAR